MASAQILVDTTQATPAEPAPIAAANPAPVPTPDPQAAAISEKYRGKSPEQLIELLEGAQTTIGRQSNEVGTMRRLVEQLAEIKRASDLGQERTNPQTTTPAAPALTADALLERPNESINSVVQALLAKELAPIRSRLDNSQASSDLDGLRRDFPDFETTATSPEFLEWRDKSQNRVGDASAAARGDARAARRLLEDYKELQEARAAGKADGKPSPKANGVAAARQVASETPGSGGQVSTKKVYNSAEIVELILKKPDVYKSAAFQAELKLAAKEGRIQ